MHCVFSQGKLELERPSGTHGRSRRHADIRLLPHVSNRALLESFDGWLEVTVLLLPGPPLQLLVAATVITVSAIRRIHCSQSEQQCRKNRGLLAHGSETSHAARESPGIHGLWYYTHRSLSCSTAPLRFEGVERLHCAPRRPLGHSVSERCTGILTIRSAGSRSDDDGPRSGNTRGT